MKDYLRSIVPTPVVTPSERFETSPGAQGQQDWSPYKLSFGEVHAFSYILGYSRRQWIEMMDGENFYNLIRCHIRAFNHLKGVARVCLYDNQKAVVIRRECGRPIYNTRFLAFATHYGFRPQALPPRTPKWKGKVERPFRYLETNFFNCRTFADKDDLDRQLQDWLANKNDIRPHGTTRRRPVDLHAEEIPHLLPLPMHPYDSAQVVYRIASIDGYIGWDGNEYSVPPVYVTQPLIVKVTETTIIVYSPEVKWLTEHELRPPHLGERFHKEEHKISRRGDHGRKELDLLIPAFLELGPASPEYLEGLKRTQTRYFGHHIARILLLKKRYNMDDIAAALDHALRYHAYDCRSVEGILSVQAQERTLEEPLTDLFKGKLAEWIRENASPPRSLESYQTLIEAAGKPASTQPSVDEENGHGDHESEDPGALEAAEAEPDRGDPGSRN